MDLNNLTPIDWSAWEIFALQAQRFARGGKRVPGIVEWAWKQDPAILNLHTHCAMAEMDDLMDNPDPALYERLHNVNCLLRAIRYDGPGVKALEAYLRIYLEKQFRTKQRRG